MASIEKRNRKWRVRWRDPDGGARSRQCPDAATAKRLHREVEQAEAEGRRWEPCSAGEVLDVREVLKGYCREIARKLRPATAERDARNLDLFLRWLVATRGARVPLPVTLLSRSLLSEYFESNAVGRLGRPRKLATRRKLVEVVEKAWKWAADEDEWTAEIPRPRRLAMPTPDGDPTVAPTWAEVDRCIAAANGWHRRVAIVMRYTGLRVGQVMGLRWDDFDLDRATLRVRGVLGKSKDERRGRVIPVSPHLVAELRTWPREDIHVIVSLRQRGGRRERVFRTREMTAAWLRAGVRKEVWRTRPDHAFRKCFTSELKRAGADAEAVEHLVGRKLGGERSTYVDPDFLPLREAVALVPAIVPVDVPRPKPGPKPKPRN